MAHYQLYCAAGEGNLKLVKSLVDSFIESHVDSFIESHVESLSESARSPTLNPSKVEAAYTHFRGTLDEALENASWKGQYHVVEYLLSLPETPIVCPFESICAKGDMKLFSMFIERGVDVNASSGYFSSPLISAVSNGQIEIVKALLVHGVNINATNGEGWNTLDYAILRKNDEMINFLRSLGMTSDKPPSAYSLTITPRLFY